MAVNLLKKLGYVCLATAILLIGGVFLWPAAANNDPEVTFSLPATTQAKVIATYVITPSQMSFTGDVTRCADETAQMPPQSWCLDMPEGSIMLGVDPTSPYPVDWDGAVATASLSIDGILSPTVAVISVTWPDRDGKGLHSPQQGYSTLITWDGAPIWEKRTRDLSDFGDYYAAQHRPVLATAVLTQSMSHTLVFSVPSHTAWDIARIVIDLYPMEDALHGIAYGPYRDCQNPHWGPYPTEAEVREDMARLVHSSNGIRTYSVLGINGEIPRIAGEYGVPVCAGAWLGREKDYEGHPVENKNREEIDALIALANTVPLDCVIVGNEVLLRHDLTEAELIAYIQEVKDAVDVPVTTAEVSGLLRFYTATVEAVDFLMPHIYPSWDGRSINSAVSYVVDHYRWWQTRYPDKRIVIGETGWPSAGPQRGAAIPSLENQQRFFYSFLDAAERYGIEYYYFDAFDELWKREGGVGSHWGYLYADRTGKHEVQSVLVPGAVLFPYRLYLPLVLKGLNTSSYFVNTSSSEASWSAIPQSQATAEDFWVFRNYVDELNHFAPSGWMGDISDLDFYECERESPFSDEVSVRVTYTPRGAQGWAGIYWQEPDGNWGGIENAGYNLDDASSLRFYARGQQGGEQIEFVMGGILGLYPDSQQPSLSTDIITLTNEWTEYAIDLRGRNLSYVIGGFGFVTNRCLNAEPITFFLDNIRYVRDGDPGPPLPTPTPQTPYAFTVYRDKDAAGNHYVPSGWMGDVGDIHLDECWRDTTRTGSTAIRVAYTAQGQAPSISCGGAQPCGWSGVYWQDPANNWGDRQGGYDLRGARGLTFWVKGESGNERLTFKVGGIGCEGSPYPDSLCPAQTIYQSPVHLTTTWQLYTIPLASTLDLSHVVGGFMWGASGEDNPEGIVFYLDDIQYLFNVDIPLYPHLIYDGPQLAEGYDMGVDTSGGLTDWVTDMNGSMCMAYPGGQSWGAVFITYGPPVPFPRPGQNLSAYRTLSLDLRGGYGGERVSIGLKDNTDPDNGTEAKQVVSNLSADWQTYTFPLSTFYTADLTRLYVVTEFVFEPGTPAETVCFRNIRYLP